MKKASVFPGGIDRERNVLREEAIRLEVLAPGIPIARLLFTVNKRRAKGILRYATKLVDPVRAITDRMLPRQ